MYVHSHLFNDFVGRCQSDYGEYDHRACVLSRTPAAHARQALLSIPSKNSPNPPQGKKNLFATVIMKWNGSDHATALYQTCLVDLL
jgi:hypothetical protein